MTTRDTRKWTIVQHSAWGYASDPGFKRAVESRHLETTREVNTVIKAGGLIFNSYTAAEDYCDEANYPDETTGSLVPAVRGSFSKHTTDGLAIYIPNPSEVR